MTNDKRIVPLKKIKSHEEYEDTKAYFEKLVKEYNTMFCQKSNPNEVAKDELKSKIESIHKGMTLDEERELHEAKTKYIMVNRDEYKSNLLENITGTLLMLEQFEASQEKRPFGEIAKGILNGDDNTKEYLRKKYTLDFSNMYGIVPASRNIYVESMDDILDYMEKNYGFVDIDLSDRHQEVEEQGLTIYNEQPTRMKEAVIKSIQKSSVRAFSEAISKDAVEKVNKKDNAEIEKHKVISRSYENDKQKSKEKEGEIERW